MHVIGIFIVLSILFRAAKLQFGSFLGLSSSHTAGRKRIPVCSICTDQYQKAKEQYRKDGDLFTFCQKITQTKDCVTGLLKNHSRCALDIQFVQLKLGYPHELRKLNCSAILSSGNSIRSRTTTDFPASLVPNGGKAVHRCVYKPKAKDKGGTVPPLHCGLFGDPHLKTFMNKRQTCVVEGAWALLDNRHLAVQVTNVHLVERPIATATSKVSFWQSYIILYSIDSPLPKQTRKCFPFRLRYFDLLNGAKCFQHLIFRNLKVFVSDWQGERLRCRQAKDFS